MSYDPRERPLPTEAQAAAGFMDRDGGRTNSYLAWAADVMMRPLYVANLKDGSGKVLNIQSGFNPRYLKNLPGENDLQHTLRYLQGVAEENVRLYENSSSYNRPPVMDVTTAYNKSKEFLTELKQREIDKGYVAPTGVPSRRGAFGEADFTDGKTAFDGGRKRRRTSKRKHRKSKTAKRRARR